MQDDKVTCLRTEFTCCHALQSEMEKELDLSVMRVHSRQNSQQEEAIL